MVERTCSSILSAPPGASTRVISAKPRRGSPTEQKTRPLTTVVKLAARNGSASARACTSDAAGARWRARPSARHSGSTPITRSPGAYSGRFRPVPQPRSSVRPRAPAVSHRRHRSSPPRSAHQQIASYSQGMFSTPRMRLHREDRKYTRVRVEQVPAADRREFAVAEEPGQREVTQPLADQRDVVIADPEESPTPTGA